MKIGDIVPYLNSRGKICQAQVEGLQYTELGIWFRGIDMKTKAAVWDSVAKSEKLIKEKQGSVQYYPGALYQPLFDHMLNEHGLILTEGEMKEIINISNKIGSDE